MSESYTSAASVVATIAATSNVTGSVSVVDGQGNFLLLSYIFTLKL